MIKKTSYLGEIYISKRLAQEQVKVIECLLISFIGKEEFELIYTFEDNKTDSKRGWTPVEFNGDNYLCGIDVANIDEIIENIIREINEEMEVHGSDELKEEINECHRDILKKHIK